MHVMLIAALIVFVIAAVLGLTVAASLFRKRETSKSVALAHGLVGATGLVLVILAVLRHPDHRLSLALVLLVVAAIGGAVLFANDVRRKPGPLALVVIHALVAVAAVALVLLAVLA